jgi:hypothetical protein
METLVRVEGTWKLEARANSGFTILVPFGENGTFGLHQRSPGVLGCSTDGYFEVDNVNTPADVNWYAYCKWG